MRAFSSWIINLLNGIDHEAYSLLKLEYQSQRDLATSLRKENDFLIKRIEEELLERKRLQDLIFKNYGITSSEDPSPGIDDKLQPISASSRRWGTLKSRMEVDDRKRAAFEKGIDAQVSGR